MKIGKNGWKATHAQKKKKNEKPCCGSAMNCNLKNSVQSFAWWSVIHPLTAYSTSAPQSGGSPSSELFLNFYFLPDCSKINCFPTGGGKGMQNFSMAPLREGEGSVFNNSNNNNENIFKQFRASSSSILLHNCNSRWRSDVSWLITHVRWCHALYLFFKFKFNFVFFFISPKTQNPKTALHTHTHSFIFFTILDFCGGLVPRRQALGDIAMPSLLQSCFFLLFFFKKSAEKN